MCKRDDSIRTGQSWSKNSRHGGTRGATPKRPMPARTGRDRVLSFNLGGHVMVYHYHRLKSNAVLFMTSGPREAAVSAISPRIVRCVISVLSSHMFRCWECKVSLDQHLFNMTHLCITQLVPAKKYQNLVKVDLVL